MPTNFGKNRRQRIYCRKRAVGRTGALVGRKLKWGGLKSVWQAEIFKPKMGYERKKTESDKKTHNQSEEVKRRRKREKERKKA